MGEFGWPFLTAREALLCIGVDRLDWAVHSGKEEAMPDPGGGGEGLPVRQPYRNADKNPVSWSSTTKQQPAGWPGWQR